MKIYWLRHGETFENRKASYYGDLEAELTPEGATQLMAYENKWPKHLQVYSSPKHRALKTAELIGYTSPIVDERLCERHMGIWEGLCYELIQSQYPKETKAWNEDWISYSIPEGESARMHYERVKSFAQMLEVQNVDALVVSHGGTMQMVLAYMFFENIEAFWKFKTSPGSLIVTTCHEGYWYVEEVSRGIC